MAKRQRDYKAEYRRRKEIAQAAGFTSVRKYRTTRKSLSLPRQSTFSIRTIRQANKKWSDERSRIASSKWSSKFSDQQALDYYRAFVVQYDSRADKLDALHDYLLDYDLITEDEWAQNYGLKAS